MAPQPRSLLVGLCLLLLGFGLGRLSLRGTEPGRPPLPAEGHAPEVAVPAATPEEPAAAPTVAPVVAPVVAPSQPSSPTWARVAELEGQVAELLEQNATLAEQMAALRAASANPARRYESTGAGTVGGPVRPDLTIGQGTVELLGLTPAEKEAAERAVRQARDALDRLESSRARVSEQTETGVTIVIEPYAEDGARIFDTLRTALNAAVGTDRGERLADQIKRRGAQPFSDFGKSKQTITAARTTDGKYRLTTARETRSESGQVFHGTSIHIADELPAGVQHLIEATD